jgi:hypothetical protein
MFAYLNLSQNDKSYDWLMYVLWVTHLVQFGLNGAIYKFEDKLVRLENASISATEESSKELPSHEQHYQPLMRKFSDNGNIQWIIFGSLYVILLVTFFLYPGKETVLYLYIPLDFCMSMAMAVFYFWQRHLDHKQKEEEREIEQAN